MHCRHVSNFSQHVNYYKDRVWNFECKDTFVSEPECLWSPYVNDLDQEFSFKCPQNYVLTGVNSYHSNYYEDRRWVNLNVYQILCSIGTFHFFPNTLSGWLSLLGVPYEHHLHFWDYSVGSTKCHWSIWKKTSFWQSWLCVILYMYDFHHCVTGGSSTAVESTATVTRTVSGPPTSTTLMRSSLGKSQAWTT